MSSHDSVGEGGVFSVLAACAHLSWFPEGFYKSLMNLQSIKSARQRSTTLYSGLTLETGYTSSQGLTKILLWEEETLQKIAE